MRLALRANSDLINLRSYSKLLFLRSVLSKNDTMLFGVQTRNYPACRLLMAAVCGAIILSSVASQPVSSQDVSAIPNVDRIEIYQVYGLSTGEINKSMRENGPNGWSGYTHGQWTYSWRYKYSNGVYWVETVSVTRELVMTLPNWRDRSKASYCVRQSYDKMYRSLVNHERHHEQLSRNVSHEAEAAIKALPTYPSSKALSEAVKKTFDDILAENQIVQQQFDAETNHGIADPNDPVMLQSCSN